MVQKVYSPCFEPSECADVFAEKWPAGNSVQARSEKLYVKETIYLYLQANISTKGLHEDCAYGETRGTFSEAADNSEVAINLLQFDLPSDPAAQSVYE
jgi:hypothetical protein